MRPSHTCNMFRHVTVTSYVLRRSTEVARVLAKLTRAVANYRPPSRNGQAQEVRLSLPTGYLIMYILMPTMIRPLPRSSHMAQMFGQRFRRPLLWPSCTLPKRGQCLLQTLGMRCLVGGRKPAPDEDLMARRVSRAILHKNHA